MLPVGDPRANEVITAFKRKGIPQLDYSSTRREQLPVEYCVEYQREYEPEDFDHARYLQVVNQVLIAQDQHRDGEGRLQIPASALRPNLRLGCVLFHAIVVSETVRNQMMDAGLVGPEFEVIVPQGQGGQEATGTFWELRSSVTLPPMPAERVVRHEGEPADHPHLGGIRDDGWFPKEIHYPQSEIEKIEPFDFALTREVFGSANWKLFRGERWPIASQRFRQFCLARSLPLEWVPVRID